MIGKDDTQEEVSFKVADRRKFNADGSVKDGVTLDAAKAAPQTVSDESSPHIETESENLDEAPDSAADEPTEEPEIPGAEDPASFVNFLSMLATNAAAA